MISSNPFLGQQHSPNKVVSNSTVSGELPTSYPPNIPSLNDQSTTSSQSKLNPLPSSDDAIDSFMMRRQIIVANTHIVANPEANDAKIWQTQMLVR